MEHVLSVIACVNRSWPFDRVPVMRTHGYIAPCQNSCGIHKGKERKGTITRTWAGLHACLHALACACTSWAWAGARAVLGRAHAHAPLGHMVGLACCRSERLMGRVRNPLFSFSLLCWVGFFKASPRLLSGYIYRHFFHQEIQAQTQNRLTMLQDSLEKIKARQTQNRLLIPSRTLLRRQKERYFL